MSTYTDVLRTPGVARIVSAQLLARFPYGMLSLALLLHVQDRLGSYAAAGVVLASSSVGQAVGGPLLARAMGPLGMRRVLVVAISISASLVIAITLLPLNLLGYSILAVLAGLFLPPIQSAVRTIYPKMVPGRLVTALYSLDATAQEIIWVAGPVITTFVAVGISTEAAILTAVAFLVGGGFWFVSSPELTRVRIPKSKQKFGGVLKNRIVVVVILVSVVLIGSFSAVEVGTVAAFGKGSADAGIVLAIFSIGSIIGGLALGHRPIDPWALFRRLLIVTVGIAAAAFAMDFWWLSLTLLVAGAGIAPALAVLFAVVSSSVKFADTAEAYGWVGTGQLMGAAGGAALAGFAIEAVGAVGAFIVGGVFITLALIASAVFASKLPDFRDRHPVPADDTGSTAAISAQ